MWVNSVGHLFEIKLKNAVITVNSDFHKTGRGPRNDEASAPVSKVNLEDAMNNTIQN